MTLKRYGAIATFFVIGPVLTESLTGNVPLATLADPLALTALSISYGGGALLVRETARRWGKGFPSIVLLGIVYGMVNEALQSGGYFDPRFYSVLELGLEDFARWQGINVFWALGITAFHAVFSITIPIVIVDTLFRGNQTLLNNTAYSVLFVIFVADSVFLWFVGGHMFPARVPPDPVSLTIVIIAMIFFAGAARMFPHMSIVKPGREPSVATLFISAVFCSAAFFFSYIGLHQFLSSPILNTMVLLFLLCLYAGLLLRYPVISHRGRVALAAGAEGPLIFSAIERGLIIQATATVALLALAWLASRREISNSSSVN